jgi:maltose O-acetyltransferase
VTILPGVRVGARSFVAAGSVVTADVPPGTLVAGAPARALRTLDPLP